MSKRYDLLFKLLLIGDCNCGKTQILHKFYENPVEQNNSVRTIGVDFGIKLINVKGKSVKLQIWDTAGQERFRSITNAYYRGAHGVIIVYNIGDRQSFHNVTGWIENTREHGSKNIKIILVGNRMDTDDTIREVSFHEGQSLAEKEGLLFMETSSVNGENIPDCFISLTESIMT